MARYPITPRSYLIEPAGNGSLVGDGPVVAVWASVPPLAHSHHEVPESLPFDGFSSPFFGCNMFWGVFKKEQFWGHFDPVLLLCPLVQSAALHALLSCFKSGV